MEILSKIAFDREDLLSAVKTAKSTISLNNTNILLQNFCIKVTKEVANVISTDLDLITVASAYPLKLTNDIIFTVPGDKLLKILSSSSEKEVLMAVTDKKVIVKLGNYQSNLVVMDAEQFPSVEDFPKDYSEVDRVHFLSSLRRISFSINQDEAKKNLMAVCLRAGSIVAADNDAASIIDFPFEGDDVLIPANAVTELIQVLTASKHEKICIGATDNWLLFKTADELFLARQSGIKFLDVSKLFKQHKKSQNFKIVFDKSLLKDSLKRASITADYLSRNILIKSSSEDSVLMVSEDSVGNTSTESILAMADAGEFVLNVRYEYLLSIINSVTSDEVVCYVNIENPKIPILVEDTDIKVLLSQYLSSKAKSDSSRKKSKKKKESDDSINDLGIEIPDEFLNEDGVDIEVV